MCLLRGPCSCRPAHIRNYSTPSGPRECAISQARIQPIRAGDRKCVGSARACPVVIAPAGAHPRRSRPARAYLGPCRAPLARRGASAGGLGQRSHLPAKREGDAPCKMEGTGVLCLWNQFGGRALLCRGGQAVKHFLAWRSCGTLNTRPQTQNGTDPIRHCSKLCEFAR